MTGENIINLQDICIQIAVAMAVGVWYVGAGVDLFTIYIFSKDRKREIESM